MNQTPEMTQKGTNFTAAQTGPFDALSRFVFHHPVANRDVEGKLFLKEALELTGMEVSLNQIPPGVAVPFLHKHKQNEELYIFVKGTGRFLVDGEAIDVRPGTVVRVSPQGERAWRNDSKTEELHYIVVQARAGTMQDTTISDGERVANPPRWP
jgi:mannose-6-phosphate isomerase-like protein (cupin superfamily)